MFLCTYLSIFSVRLLHRHALSSPPTWWTCWGSSHARGPWLRGRLSAWWLSSTANSAQSRPSWSRALVKPSWSWGLASSMPGEQSVFLAYDTLYWSFLKRWASTSQSLCVYACVVVVSRSLVNKIQYLCVNNFIPVFNVWAASEPLFSLSELEGYSYFFIHETAVSCFSII